MEIRKSDKLANVFYDLRGPVLEAATRLEEEGHRILKQHFITVITQTLHTHDD